MPTISIIVPAYNCEDTIKQCIDSIINQTSTDWELVIVNDGSTDKTKEICESYLDSEKVFLYTQSNSGVSSARNLGVEHSTGDYLLFVDSDDSLLPDALSIVKNTIKDADICYYNYQKINSRNLVLVDYIENASIIDFKEFSSIFCELFESGYINPPWGKCYRRALIKERFRNNINIGEDLLFNLNYIKQCSSISLVPHAIYNYREANSNSLSNNNKDKMDQLKNVYAESIQICGNLFEDSKSYKCITNKYIVDQLVEIEKKIRFKTDYKLRDMKYDIHLSNISTLSKENPSLITSKKWSRAVNMLKKEYFPSLFLYLKIYKVLGGIKHVIRKD